MSPTWSTTLIYFSVSVTDSSLSWARDQNSLLRSQRERVSAMTEFDAFNDAHDILGCLKMVRTSWAGDDLIYKTSLTS